MVYLDIKIEGFLNAYKRHNKDALQNCKHK